MEGLKYANQLLSQTPAGRTTQPTGYQPRLTLATMRRAVPEAEGVSDRELVSAWSQLNGIPFDELANEVGLPTRGLLRTMGTELVSGATVDTPSMVGQGMQFMGRNFGAEDGLLSRMGAGLEESAERRGVTRGVDERGRNWLGGAFTKGIRALPPSATGLVATGAAAASGAGLPVAMGIGGATVGTLFGTSQGEDTYRRVLEETGDPEAAQAASLRTAATTAGFEALAGVAAARLITGPVRAAAGAKTMKGVLDKVNNPEVYKEFARALAINYPIQIGTEVAQEVSASMIEQFYGASPEDLMAIAGESAQAAFGLTTLFGFGGLGSASIRSRNADRLRRSIDGDESIPQAERVAAITMVRQMAEAQGVPPEQSTRWARSELRKIQAHNRKIERAQNAVETGVAARQVLEAAEPGSPEAIEAQRQLDESSQAFGEAAEKLSGISMREAATGNQRELTVEEAAFMDLGTAPEWAVTAQQSERAAAGEEVDLTLAAPRPGDGFGVLTDALYKAVQNTEQQQEQRQQELEQSAVAEQGEIDLAVPEQAQSAVAEQGEIDLAVPEQAQSAVAEQAQQGEIDLAVPEQAQSAVAEQAQQAEVEAQNAATANALARREEQGAVAQQAAPLVEVPGVENKADAISDDKQVAQVIKTLDASVRTEGTQASEGRVSFPQQVLAAIGLSNITGRAQPVRVKRSPAVDKALTEQWGERVASAFEASRALATAYNTLLKSSNLVSRSSGQAQERARAKVAAMAEADTNVQNAITGLQKAVADAGGTPRDVDAIVAVTKALAQKRLRKSQAKPVRRAILDADIGLSRAWAAKSAGAYDGETGDAFFVRGTQTREAREITEAATASLERAGLDPANIAEQVSEQQPLRQAVEQGRAIGGNPNVDPASLTRFQSLLNNLRAGGTAYEMVLAKALDLVRVQMESAGRVVDIQFSDGTPGYDPATNTITITDTASPEVQLHESLHAALQWFVHTNPENAAVQQLRTDLNTLLDYDGALDGQAEQIRDMLSDMVTEGRELDAILELVSYTNTHLKFRRALENIPPSTPRSFTEKLSDLWRSVLRVVQQLLGEKQSVARNVMQRTFELLQDAARANVGDMRVAPQGQALMAAIQSEQPPPGVPKADYQRYRKDQAVMDGWTKMLWDSVRLDAPVKAVAKIGKATAELVRKNAPGLEIAITHINSNFSVPQVIKRLKFTYKRLRNAPYQQLELLVTDIDKLPPKEQLAVKNYLDGDKKALDGMKNQARIQLLADSVLYHIKEQVKYLPKRERTFFENRPLSKALAYATNLNEVAKHNLLTGGIGRLLGLKSHIEPAITWPSAWYKKDANGNLDTADNYYAVQGPDLINPANKELQLQGFISKEIYEAQGDPAGMGVDTSRVWRVDAVDKTGYKFTSSKNYSEARDVVTGTQFANGLRNTMAALAANRANRHLLANLYSLGRDGYTSDQIKKGVDPDANAVTFDTLAQVERVMGVKLDADKVLNVGELPEGKGELRKIRNRYRASGTWVKMPTKDGYGPLKGKYVPGPVWNSLMDMNDRSPVLNSQVLQRLMQVFKKAKTTLNPGTHVTNTLTNFTLAYMHDLSTEQVVDAFKTYAYFHTNPGRLKPEQLALMRDFMDSGAMLGDLSTAEIKQDLFKSMLEQLDPRAEDSVLTKLSEFAGYENSKMERLAKRSGGKIKGFDENMLKLYSAEDNVFRLAIFMKRVGEIQNAKGEMGAPTEQTIEEAGVAARQAYVDYDIDSPAIRYLRQTWLPFVSFTYGVLPVLGRIALTQPWKIANVMTGFYATGAALAAMSDGDDEELRKIGPEYLRDRMFGIGPYMHMRLPFGDERNPVYIRLGDYFPLAGSTGGMPNGFMGQSWWPQALSPSNPFITTMLALFGGVDAYTGKEIHNVTDDDFQKLLARARATYDAYSVPLVSSRNIETVGKAVRGDTTMTGASVNPTAFARMLGLRLYQIDMEEAEMFQSIAVDGIRRDYGVAMARLRREAAQSGWLNYEKLDKELEKLMTKMEKQITKARGEE